MTALAAFVNTAVPKDQTINLYYNTSTAQIAVSLKTGTDGPDPDTDAWAAGQDDYPGYILNPSQIAGGTFHGVSLVIAVTMPFLGQGATQTVNQISLVSPVYKKLTTTSLANKNTAFTSTDRNAWVYYLDGSANGQISLKEYNFLTGKVAPYLANQDITLNSSLASWYNSVDESRHVVYQELNQNHVKEFNVTSGQTWDIDSTEGAASDTTVAATYFNTNTFLYYVDSSSNVRRVIKHKGSWGPSKLVQNCPKLGSGQLTVTTANGFNHLFFVSQDNSFVDDFTHVPDPIEV